MLSRPGVKHQHPVKCGDEPDFPEHRVTISIIRGVSCLSLGSHARFGPTPSPEEPRLMAMVQATALMALITGVVSTSWRS